MRVKPSPDYDSDGITLRFRRPSPEGSTYWSRSIESNGNWQTITWDFDQIRGARNMTFEVEVKPGSGYLLFDDIEIIDTSRRR